MAQASKTSDDGSGAKVPKKVSAWEIAGVPAAGVFAAAYHLGWLARLGFTEEQLPDLMLITYVVAAFVRALGRQALEAIAKVRKG